jgi:hypothetical protein
MKHSNIHQGAAAGAAAANSTADAATGKKANGAKVGQ